MIFQTAAHGAKVGQRQKFSRRRVTRKNEFGPMTQNWRSIRLRQIARQLRIRTSESLLRVSHFAVYERDLQILVHVNLLGTESDDFIGLAERGDHLVRSLPELHAGGLGLLLLIAAVALIVAICVAIAISVAIPVAVVIALIAVVV